MFRRPEWDGIIWFEEKYYWQKSKLLKYSGVQLGVRFTVCGSINIFFTEKSSNFFFYFFIGIQWSLSTLDVAELQWLDRNWGFQRDTEVVFFFLQDLRSSVKLSLDFYLHIFWYDRYFSILRSHSILWYHQFLKTGFCLYIIFLGLISSLVSKNQASQI